MEFRLLGALEVEDEGRPFRSRGGQERTLLAALLLRPNEAVSRERLIEELWHDRPPRSARHSLEASISRLRKTLGSAGAALEALPPDGYRLRVDPEHVDVYRFERLVEQGRGALAAGDAAAAETCFTGALSLWRGRPFAELAGDDAAELEAARLEELRLSALEGRIDALLALGRCTELVGELRMLAAAQPLREQLQVRLMLVLYRCGRQAEALDVYRRTRSRLVDELGIEPGRELQELQQAILRQDAALDPPACSPAAQRERRPEPSAPAVLHEERKPVTVLACELGPADPGALDPEDRHALLSRAHAHLQAALEPFGGSTEPLLGTSTLVYFGAPHAHEDDPERAVRAALAIRDRFTGEPGVHVRIGLDRGECLVVLDSAPTEGNGIVTGAAVETAAAICAAAPPGMVLVSRSMRDATASTFEYRRGPSPSVPEGAGPLAAWEAVQPRRPVGEAPAARAPLIGRGRELALLLAQLDRARAEELPQLVTIVGEPGIGKTRLIAELRAAVERSGRSLTWRQGRSLPYGGGISYWALAEIVKAAASVRESDAPEVAAQKLREITVRLLPDEAEARWVEPHLRPLLGFANGDSGDADRRDASFAAWRRLLEAIAEQRPLVLVFENLHWADDGLLDFVEGLADRLTEVPALVVASARPELLARRPGWAGGKANATTLSLRPLTERETRRLVRALPGGGSLSAPLQEVVVARGGGNPLHVEELVRLAAERGLEAELPESVQALITARLDVLPPAEKSLLQDAAVVGAVFWASAVAALAGVDPLLLEQPLHELERRELVRRTRHSDLSGETQYAFRHVLVRDVAYATIPRAARGDRHRRAAEWIESLGRPDDHADLLAHHYASALELASETGAEVQTLLEPTVRALCRAGDRAFALNAFRQAVGFYDRALSAGVSDDALGRVLLRLGAALHFASDGRRVEVLERARQALLAGGDVEAAAEASTLLGAAWLMLGRPDRNRQAVERAATLLRGRGPSPATARVLAWQARSAALELDHETALRLGRSAYSTAERLGLDDVVVSALDTTGVARVALGDRAGGIADLERAIALGLETHDPEVATAYSNLAGAIDTGEQLERGLELHLRGLRAAARLGNEAMRRFIAGNLVLGRYRAGEWDEAFAAADALLAEAAAGQDDHNCRRAARQGRAWILLARDDEEGARREMRAVLELVHDSAPVARVITLASAVRVFGDLGDETEEAAALDELLPLVGRGSLVYTAGLALALEPLGRGDVLRSALAASPAGATHRVAHAILAGDYARAADLLCAGGERTFEAEARLRAAVSLAAAGRADEADDQLVRVLAFYRSVGASRYIRAAESQRRGLGPRAGATARSVRSARRDSDPDTAELAVSAYLPLRSINSTR